MQNIYTIIVTYNGEKWIKNCLDSLLNSNMSTSIIVIDNGSTDGSLNILDNYKEKIELIKSPVNLGFGGGNNLGIKKAIEYGAVYIFLLNQDAYVNEQTIEQLLHFASKNEGYGIISPMQMAPGGVVPDPLFKQYYTHKGISGEDIIEVRFVNAAAWFISAEVFKKSGLFHPAFFHYGEDNHFCSRIQYHGKKVGILKTAFVIHDRQINTNPEKKLLQQIRTVPLYTLLDIRKPLFISWLLGLQKLNRFKSKMIAFGINKETIDAAYKKEKEWFFSRFSEAKKIRKETKTGSF